MFNSMSINMVCIKIQHFCYYIYSMRWLFSEESCINGYIQSGWPVLENGEEIFTWKSVAHCIPQRLNNIQLYFMGYKVCGYIAQTTIFCHTRIMHIKFCHTKISAIIQQSYCSKQLILLYCIQMCPFRYDSVFLYDACKPIPCGSQCINCSVS